MPDRHPKMSYAELHCISNFSFLRGASHPEELVAEAARQGYRALAITDECSLAGVVKAHVAAREHGLHLIIGAEFRLDGELLLVLLAPDRRAYAELSGLITLARRRSPKGEYAVQLRDFEVNVRHCLAIWLPGTAAIEPLQRQGEALGTLFAGRLWLGVELLLGAGEQQRYLRLYQLAARLGLPMVACGGVEMHVAQRKALADTLCAIRLNTPVQQLGTRLAANAERHLRALERLRRLYPAALLAESVRIAQRCSFTLGELRYEYPEEVVPPGMTPTAWLRRLVLAGAQQRWPDGVPRRAQALIEKELVLIAELAYEYYFLTVHDLVQFARGNGILCQGRGSAANSAVCYCLFITEVDPDRSSVLFERFISKERNEPPDIDVDFEHERREEVIQYIYRKYTRERAALAATIISYRPRSAVRDVGKALGLDPLFVEQLAKSLSWWDRHGDLARRFEEEHLAGASSMAGHFMRLVREILGFPRHLSQHVGGFIITRSPIAALVPVENAAMMDRTVIQWDKNDIEALGLLKVDILALGMLSALRRAFALIRAAHGVEIDMSRIPAEDPCTFAMLARADSVGVFQVESRAQMAMLPRLKPRTFYDLVIEVAIVRPGPIQGDMVHPYLKRRQGLEPVTYPNEEVRAVLERTLGVPIFQEQVIKLAMVAAGFSGGEADQLRRAMAAWKRNGTLAAFEDKVINGMLARGHSREFAERLFNQMKGFGDYGFPESHAASFALLAYASAWLKCHYPAAFCCALLNSQPMGFYSPSQLVQDLRRHGVTVLPVDVDRSEWDCALERCDGQSPALRLGLRQISGFNAAAAGRIVAARRRRAFDDLHDLARRALLDRSELDLLAGAGALVRLGGHRHQAHWQAAAIEEPRPLFDRAETAQLLHDAVELPAPGEAEDLVQDYRSIGLTLGRHPLALLRARQPFAGCCSAHQLHALNSGRFVRVAGLVTGRQRPGTASGVLFLTLEDETGNINVVVWRDRQERFRKALLRGKLLLVKGVMESRDSVVHVIAGEILDHSAALGALQTRSRDFH
ncbi:MAG TPA: error-prone DNA polymerase [Pseudomonadales bacterium]|nr:error-prone DNA polymerase [Pseudomonadales bacterium]